MSHGTHQVFQLAEDNLLCLGDCLPIYIHGDEGTTYKKDGCLVISIMCPIGQGVASARCGESDLKMNFLGHGFMTRLVLATLLKASKAKNRDFSKNS